MALLKIRGNKIEKKLSVLIKTLFLFAILSITLVSAHDSPYDNRYRFSTISLEKQYSYSKENYYYETSNLYVPRASPIYKHYIPEFTEYKTRSYGHGTQLVRFRIEPFSYDCYRTCPCNNYYDGYLKKDWYN